MEDILDSQGVFGLTVFADVEVAVVVNAVVLVAVASVLVSVVARGVAVVAGDLGDGSEVMD